MRNSQMTDTPTGYAPVVVIMRLLDHPKASLYLGK